MTTSILLASYTDQGIRNIAKSPERLDAARELGKEVGVEIKDFYLTMGSHDIVAVVTGPDDAAIARFVMALAARGNVRTTTLKAFPEAEYREIAASVP